MDHPLQTQDLRLERAGREVLHGVTVSFPRGVATALVGPSGAGKTSLLRCLNRLEEPSEGRVLLDGVDVRSVPPTELRRRVGMIFQTPVLFPGGVGANLAYGLRSHSRDDLAAALEAVGLPVSFLDREAFALSVGQAQRVCIARALVRQPEVLLMDEPTSALDREAAARIERLIGDLAQRGLTVVLVTHDLPHARRVSDRGILLNDGYVMADGGWQEIEDAWPGEESL